MRDAHKTKVIRVAVLVTADTRLKVLSRALDDAFEDHPEILQFTIEDHGSSADGDRNGGVALERARRQHGRPMLQDPGRA